MNFFFFQVKEESNIKNNTNKTIYVQGQREKVIMGKRFSESAAKKIAGQARKRDQAAQKHRAEVEKLEAEEAAKWEEGSRKTNPKKLEEEQKRLEKLEAKKKREAQLAEEEAMLGRGGKGRRLKTKE